MTVPAFLRRFEPAVWGCCSSPSLVVTRVKAWTGHGALTEPGEEAVARYKGMSPKRAGRPEPGDVASAAEDGDLVRLKNEASLHAYSSPGSVSVSSSKGTARLSPVNDEGV